MDAAQLSVTERIESLIRDAGPIPFSRFMEEALYGEGGFYEGTPIGSGPGSSFVTSPHVHPVFGQLLGSAVAELWDLLGRPDPLKVVEVGAGDGTLARQLTDALSPIAKIDYTAVERGSLARELSEGVATVADLSTIDGGHVLLANELLDNLPFDLRMDGSDVTIGLDDEGLEPIANGEPLEDLALAEIVPVKALEFIERLSELMAGRPSYALLIDYGGRTSGPVHGYRAHALVEDVLAQPGSSDITAGVDFSLLSASATERGLVAHEPITQREALIALGLEGWIEEELQRQQRLLDEGEGVEAVRAWGGRSRATLLAEPAGLGRLKWFLLSTPELPPPSWLGENGS